MRIVLALILISGLASFALTFAGTLTPVAHWSDIEPILRQANVSDSSVAEIHSVLSRGRRPWLIARCLSAGVVILSLVGLFLPPKRRQRTEQIV